VRKVETAWTDPSTWNKQLNSIQSSLFFVFIQAWGRESGGAAAGIKFLSDSSAELTRALGLVMETPMMPRTKRFSMIVEDGVVTHYGSSNEQASDTWAPAMLAKL
jgi:2-Cys peroxiredoxin 5